MISHVPGGLGVFETVMILFLSPEIPASSLMGSLLAYRAVYYLLPLAAAIVMLGVHETIHAREKVRKATDLLGRWIALTVPHIFALTTFIGGGILLFSGATPAVRGRMVLLKDILPLPVLEVSHFLGSLAGAGLILIARGIQRKLDAAYFMTLALLASGAAFSLLKGLDYEEAGILSCMFLLLLPCRKYFYRKASLFSESFNQGWITAIMVILAASLWIGLFSYKHIEYSGDLWWHFAFYGDAPRFLRAGVGAAVVMMLFLVAKLLRPHQPGPSLPERSDLEKAKSIAMSSIHTYAYISLLGDKSLLFSESGRSFIMYGIEGRSWVAMGDPVGADDDKEELIWKFRELSDRYDGWPVFYEIGEDNLHYYADLGLSFIKLGEDGRVRLETFSLEGGGRREMRHTLHKLDREGCSFEIVQPKEVPALLPKFRMISDAWLKEKHTREKGFSLGYFNEDYLMLFPAAIVKKGGDIIAFANLWPGAEKEELTIDLMRYHPDAPNGVMDYLFIHLLQWGKIEGYRWFGLGMAPFSGLDDHTAASLWNKLGDLLYRHGEHFYNFQGLRQYKDKFDPVWRPKYLAYPAFFTLPRISANIASLVSGGLKGVVAK
jgi:phosphatidylglycerol lysyltransferase